MGETEYQINDNLDLTRGFKEYESVVKNIRGIFEKIGSILDINDFKAELDDIQTEVLNDKSIDSEMPSTEMQLEYESMVLAPYISRLKELTERLEKECLPFYELYLLSSKIGIQLSKISEDNISSIIDSTRELLDSLNELNSHNEPDKNHIIDQAYDVIYSVILHEELFDRGDILEYLNRLNISTNREHIGRLLSNDLSKVDREVLIEDDLKALTSDKLGNDYLSREVIKRITNITVGNENSEYKERRRKAIEDIKEEVIDLANEKKNLTDKLSANKSSIRNLRIRKSIQIARLASLVLIPVVIISAGNKIGKNKSEKITEYRSVTRTVDYDTGKMLGDVEYSFDEEKSPYVATVLSCTPWRKNPAGIGYIRNVTTYEYVAPEDTEENHRINAYDLENNVKEKYTYIETKEELDGSDSMDDMSILITESYPDGETRPSTKYIIPFTVVGVILSILIDVLLVLTRICSFEDISYIINEVNDEIKTRKMNDEEIKNRLKELLKEAEETRVRYNETARKYGSYGDLIIEEIDTSWILGKKSKSLIKKPN